MSQQIRTLSSTAPWHVLGVGALGGLWAARLSSLVPVQLLVRQRPSVQQFPNGQAQNCWRSLCLIDGERRHSFELPVATPAAVGLPIQHLLLATKSYDAVAAIESISHRLDTGSSIYLMQNGLGSQNTIASRYSNLAVYALSTTEGANRRYTGEIVHAGHGKTWIGPLTISASIETAQHSARLFTQAGLEAEATSDIREKLWLKLAINCAINPFTAILDCANGELPTQPFFMQRIDPLCAEIAQAMTAAGYSTSAASLRERVADVISATASNISSMLQDRRAGRRTEIDAINGFLTDFCVRQHINCPVNQELERLVRCHQRL